MTGNPLYPLEVRLLGHTVLHGWYRSRSDEHQSLLRAVCDWRALGDILLAVLDPRLAPVWIAHSSRLGDQEPEPTSGGAGSRSSR